jgi:hypothetical protein
MAKNSEVFGKEKSEKGNVFAKGGTTKMFGEQDASPANPGTSSPNNGNVKANNKFGIGYSVGKTSMFGEQDASPAMPGESSPANGRKAPDNNWGVKGGTTKMFGPQTADTALPGSSAPRNG